MEIRMDGKVAVVAAASKGLGKASALELARAGAAVVVGSRDRAAIEAAAREIREATGAEAVPVVADVSRAEDCTRLVRAAADRFGRVDALVTNAGGPPPGGFDAFDDAAWYAAFDLTFMSTVRLIREALPAMRAQRSGSIVTITSMSVKQPIPNLLLSNAMRTGVVGLLKTLAIELGPEGIRVNNVAPGRIATDRVAALDAGEARRQGVDVETVRRQSAAGIPLGRYGEPEEFGRVVAFLCSDAASYVSGVTLLVDGAAVRTLY